MPMLTLLYFTPKNNISVNNNVVKLVLNMTFEFENDHIFCINKFVPMRGAENEGQLSVW